MEKFSLPSPIQQISDERLDTQGVKLFVKRDDLIGTELSGNKYRKLYLNIAHFKKGSFKGIITYGGAFSNHIHAMAAAGKMYGIESHGIIRGEEPANWSPTLLYAKTAGMHLHFVTRKAYKAKDTASFLKDIMPKNIASTSLAGMPKVTTADIDNYYLIPEGGTNQLAIEGCRTIVREATNQIASKIDHWFVPCGTGGTAAGMIAEMEQQKQVTNLHVMQILKGAGMEEHIQELLTEYNCADSKNWEINSAYHFGGYAKWNEELISFINEFKERHDIALDPIYTGKMMYGIFDMIANGKFEKGSTLLAIHTGGQQGIAGFNFLNGQRLTVNG